MYHSEDKFLLDIDCLVAQDFARKLSRNLMLNVDALCNGSYYAFI